MVRFKLRRFWAGVFTTGLVATIAAQSAAAHGDVIIPTVIVGNPGNAGEWSGDCAGGHGPCRMCGAVPYVYYITKFEVTAGQYTEFLNAVAADDKYYLYNPLMWSSDYGCKIRQMGSPGSFTYSVDPDWADRPVNYVSWGDAARFANWMHNGQPSGPQTLSTTEDGSYFLNGATSNAALLAVTRKPSASWVIPSEDEWYKAAYHRNDGVTGNYWDYATRTNATPNNGNPEGDTGNSANFCDGDYSIGPPYWRTTVGFFGDSPSPYGTFDQCGNVWECTEAELYGTARSLRGGSFCHYLYDLPAANRDDRDSQGSPPTSEGFDLGFRLALRYLLGDVNCDGVISYADINPFVVALSGSSEYLARFPYCNYLSADCNRDGYVTYADINPFVRVLGQ
jgi:formylglycine-generating enzyme